MERHLILGFLFFFSLFLCLLGTAKLLWDTLFMLIKGELDHIKKEWSANFYMFTTPGVIIGEFFSRELRESTSTRSSRFPP